MKDKYIENWLSGLSERTKENYLREFPQWLEFIKLSPIEQIEKRLKDLTSQNLTERTFFENKFRAYKEYLEQNTTLTASSIKTMLRTVASFFSRNGLPLALKRGDWQSTKETKVIQRFKLSKEDVKALYQHANLRDKSLLLVLAQSGFSEVDVANLKIEDIKGLYEMAETEHYFIEKPREKTNIIQATCISYEALHDIRAMLSERGSPKEGFLFVSQTKAKGSPIETRRINEAMKTLAERTFGIEKAKEFQTKALRSFYNSALLRARIQPQELKDVMLGHKRLGARGHYAYDEYTIKEAYTMAFEHLTVNGIQTREDVHKLELEQKELKSQIFDMQKQLEEMRKILDMVSNKQDTIETRKALKQYEDKHEAK